MKTLAILIFVLLISILATLGFVVGFLIGWGLESCQHKHKKAAHVQKTNDIAPRDVSENEKKALREWKKFLKYDGATPDETKV